MKPIIIIKVSDIASTIKLSLPIGYVIPDWTAKIPRGWEEYVPKDVR